MKLKLLLQFLWGLCLILAVFSMIMLIFTHNLLWDGIVFLAIGILSLVLLCYEYNERGYWYWSLLEVLEVGVGILNIIGGILFLGGIIK